MKFLKVSYTNSQCKFLELCEKYERAGYGLVGTYATPTACGYILAKPETDLEKSYWLRWQQLYFKLARKSWEN